MIARAAAVLVLAMLCAPALQALTLDQLVKNDPDVIERLFDELDLESEALATAAAAHAQGDTLAACRALLEFYRQKHPLTPSEAADQSTAAQPDADAILKDRYTAQGVTATLPRLKGRRLDWSHRGPKNDPEFAWGVNRFFHFNTLLSAYHETGDTKYAARISDEIEDWALSSPYPAGRSTSAQWRGLEIALRIAPWSRAFRELQHEPAFSDAARILMLSVLPAHASYLMRYPGRNNWVTMEMNGLARIAFNWPEFKDTERWLTHAEQVMTPELRDQVYSDGAQKELTSHYHRVALTNFESFARQYRDAGRPLPDDYATRLERMWNYLAYTMRPSGFGLLNNDSDLDDNRALIASAAKRYARPDWEYIVTNGDSGKRPRRKAQLFAWAGHALMRSGYDTDARWSFFDIGPDGVAHVNIDRNHLSLSAYGRDLLVDAGRYSYVKGSWRDYYVSSFSHNVVHFSGASQERGEASTAKSLKERFERGDGYAYSIGAYLGDYHRVLALSHHTRAVVYLEHMDLWVVVDKLFSDREQSVEAMWHFHPECDVILEGNDAVTRHEGRGHLRITPVGDVEWEPRIAKGEEKPRVQGWYSPRYNEHMPAPCVLYPAKIGANNTYAAWIMTPGESQVPPVNASMTVTREDLVQVEIQHAGKSIKFGIETLLESDGRPRVALP